jgi:hypothetical protein
MGALNCQRTDCSCAQIIVVSAVSSSRLAGKSFSFNAFGMIHSLQGRRNRFSIFHFPFVICHCRKTTNFDRPGAIRVIPASGNVKSQISNEKWKILFFALKKSVTAGF